MSSTGTGISNSHNTVSVLTSATAIVGGRNNRKSLLVVNTSTSATLYVGGSGVTTANGIPIAPGSTNSLNSISFDELSGPLYGISSSGTLDARYLEIF